MKIIRVFLLTAVLGQSCSIESGTKDISLFWNSFKMQLLQRFVPFIKRLSPQTSREASFFAAGVGFTGITFVALLPKILRTIRENFKMPWTMLSQSWRGEYQEKITEVGTFVYKKRDTKAKIVHLSPREGSPAGSDETYAQKIWRTKFDPRVPLQENTAILFLPGLGDIWQLMAPDQHQELFPTNEFYVPQFPDSEARRTLKTTVGGIDEVLIALLCLKYLADKKKEDGSEKYDNIIVFAESRGTAVAVLMQAFLDNWNKTNSKPFFDQKPDDDPYIHYNSDIQYDYAQILEKAKIELTKDDVTTICQKLHTGGFVFLSPLESYKDVARLIASSLPTGILRKFGRYVLTSWAAPNLTYFDPKVQKDPTNVVQDWSDLSETHIFYSPTIHDDVLGNEANELFLENLRKNYPNVYNIPHRGIHIKMEDPQVRQQLWNFMNTGNPEKSPSTGLSEKKLKELEQFLEEWH